MFWFSFVLRSSWCTATLLLLGHVVPVFSAIVEYDFDIKWIWLNSDGVTARSVIGINNAWPPPMIAATVGDTIIVNVLNSLGNQSTSLHFHGLFMNGTSNMDGTSYVSQCAIRPGSRFTYNFTVAQSGTYWYHSHEKSQYPDGLRGLLIVHDPESPYRSQYDEELVLSVSDWYNEPVSTLLSNYDRVAEKMPHDPLPDVNLLNDTRNLNIRIQLGRTYLVHLANIGALAGQYFWIEDHEMTIVEADGIYVEPARTDMIYLASGQRYSFLLTTKDTANRNYAMVSRVDRRSFSMHDKQPKDLDAIGWLVYNSAMRTEPPRTVDKLNAFNDMMLVPLDHMALLTDVDHSLTINIDMHRKSDGMVHWLFNTVNYQSPKLPSLFAAIEAGENATNPNTYDSTTQAFVLKHNEVIEIVMNNKHMRPHPIHLHGHNFQIIQRSGGTPVQGVNALIPPRRDTVIVNNHGNLTIRFRADNPGVWLFHCHMEWHAHSGLVATIIEAPLELQQQRAASQLRLDLGRRRNCDSLMPEEAQIADTQPTASEHSKAADRPFSRLRFATSHIVALTLSLAFVTVSLCAYLWQRSRRQARDNNQYTLVPVHNVDELADGINDRVDIDGAQR